MSLMLPRMSIVVFCRGDEGKTSSRMRLVGNINSPSISLLIKPAHDSSSIVDKAKANSANANGGRGGGGGLFDIGNVLEIQDVILSANGKLIKNYNYPRILYSILDTTPKITNKHHQGLMLGDRFILEGVNASQEAKEFQDLLRWALTLPAIKFAQQEQKDEMESQQSCPPPQNDDILKGGTGPKNGGFDNSQHILEALFQSTFNLAKNTISNETTNCNDILNSPNHATLEGLQLFQITLHSKDGNIDKVATIDKPMLQTCTPSAMHFMDDSTRGANSSVGGGTTIIQLDSESILFDSLPTQSGQLPSQSSQKRERTASFSTEEMRVTFSFKKIIVSTNFSVCVDATAWFMDWLLFLPSRASLNEDLEESKRKEEKFLDDLISSLLSIEGRGYTLRYCRASPLPSDSDGFGAHWKMVELMPMD